MAQVNYWTARYYETVHHFKFLCYYEIVHNSELLNSVKHSATSKVDNIIRRIKHLLHCNGEISYAIAIEFDTAAVSENNNCSGYNSPGISKPNLNKHRCSIETSSIETKSKMLLVRNWDKNLFQSGCNSTWSVALSVVRSFNKTTLESDVLHHLCVSVHVSLSVRFERSCKGQHQSCLDKAKIENFNFRFQTENTQGIA